MFNGFFLQFVLGQLRHALTAVGASLVTEGLLTNDELQAVVAAVVTLAALAWSAWDKWQRERKGKDNGR